MSAQILDLAALNNVGSQQKLQCDETPYVRYLITRAKF